MGLSKFRPLVKSCFFKKSYLVFIEQKLTTIMKEQKYSLVWTGDLKDSLQRISTLRYRILFDLFHKIPNGRSARSAKPFMPQVPLSTFPEHKWHFGNCSCVAITPSAFNMFRLDASCRQHRRHLRVYYFFPMVPRHPSFTPQMKSIAKSR